MVRLLSWKPTLVYACLGADYTPARMVEGFAACRREAAQALLELLTELVEVHAAVPAAELAKAQIPPLAPVCRLLGVLLDARHVDLCLTGGGSAELERLARAVGQHSERMAG